LLTAVNGEVSPEKDKYVRQVRSLLEIGDLDGLRKLDIQVPSKRAPVKQLPAQPKPVQSKPGYVSPDYGSSVQVSRPLPKPVSVSQEPVVRKRPNRLSHRKRGDLNFSRFLMLILGIVLVGSGGILWMQQYEFPTITGWPDLPGLAKNDKPETPAPSSLEVVDCGKVYDRLIKGLAQASMGQMVAQSKDRYKALASLRTEAGDPLIQQARFFLKHSGNGIQPGNRQDKEMVRLQSLFKHGAALETELQRLELAWFSLSSGTDWNDLGKLSRRHVVARRDSLSRVSAHSLKTSGQELGIVGLVSEVAIARGQVEGMADLLSLFNASTWSRQWQDVMPKAARKVPSDSNKITRAYRNSAKVLVQLKEVERKTLAEDLAFSGKFGTEAWFPYDIVELLPSLEKQVSRFPRGETPSILSETLAIYEVLQKAAKGECPGCNDSAELQKLMANEALRFDSAVYGDIADRIRFEAARYKLEQGANPADLPDVYFPEGDREATVGFISALDAGGTEAHWTALAGSSQRQFFRRWAKANSRQAAKKSLALNASFNSDWTQLKELRDRVAILSDNGRDWTAAWHDLRNEVLAMQEKYPASWANGNRSALVKIQIMELMVRRLDYSGQVDVTGVIVRLGPEFDTPGKEVIVQLSKIDGSPVGKPHTLQLGPAAPAGSGWVGTGVLNWQFNLARDENLVASVKDASSGRILQEINYQSLVQRVGCGELGRVKTVGEGSLKFKIAPGYWHGLVLPVLP